MEDFEPLFKLFAQFEQAGREIESVGKDISVGNEVVPKGPRPIKIFNPNMLFKSKEEAVDMKAIDEESMKEKKTILDLEERIEQIFSNIGE